jgi:hypothetical protein
VIKPLAPVPDPWPALVLALQTHSAVPLRFLVHFHDRADLDQVVASEIVLVLKTACYSALPRQFLSIRAQVEIRTMRSLLRSRNLLRTTWSWSRSRSIVIHVWWWRTLVLALALTGVMIDIGVMVLHVMLILVLTRTRTMPVAVGRTVHSWPWSLILTRYWSMLRT